MEKVLISFSVLLLSALALGACGSPVASSKTSTSSVPSASLSSSPASASSSSAGARLKAKTVELYQTETAHSPFQLFFDQTIPDIPFIALPDAKDFLVEVIAAELKDSSYALALNDEAGVITLTRENGSKAVFDFNHQTLTFNSFEAFSTLYFAATPLDPVSLHSKDSAGNPLYLIHDQTNSSSKAKGVSLNLNLAAYQIPLVYEGGVGYIPVQTYSDLFLSQTLGTLAYNGTALFLANGSFAPVQALYYSAAPRKRSVALSEFTYHELCLALDVYYGLKNEHGIVDFDSYFTNNGVKADLLSTDAAVADKALARFIN